MSNPNPRIFVLDSGYVQLQQHWGSDEDIVRAARMSTNKGFQGWGTRTSPGDEKLLEYLYTSEPKHTSPFEMGGVTIEVQAPLFVIREWHRHRTQSYNEMSARYAPMPDNNYVPTGIRVIRGAESASKNKQARGVGDNVPTAAQVSSDIAALEAHYKAGQALYERLLASGWPKELARLPVPVARYSRMWASANLLNWLKFLVLREDVKAQEEIRVYAAAVHTILAPLFPRTISLFEIGQIK